MKLGNVLDLQLLDVEHRRVKNPKQPLPETKSGLYWKIVGDNVDRLWGYKKCLEEYLEDPALVSIKDKGTKEMLDNKTEKKNVWADRPLTDSLKEYCAVDTQAMFPLFDILSSGKDLQLVKAASGRYADHRRSYVTLPSNDNYTFHAFLPHHLLDVDSSYKGTLLFTYQMSFMHISVCNMLRLIPILVHLFLCYEDMLRCQGVNKTGLTTTPIFILISR